MSVKLNKFELDAIKFDFCSENIENINAHVLADLDSQLSDILLKLKYQELKSILFLLIGHHTNQTLVDQVKWFLECMQSSKQLLQIQIRNMLNSESNTGGILQELLGTIQNFKLLKQLGVCRHQFLERKDRYKAISHMWKILYNFCDQLDDSDLISLKMKFLPDSSEVVNCGEELICQLIIRHEISDNNFQNLITVLENEGHNELANIIKELNINEREEIIDCYYIPEPTRSSPCGFAVVVNVEKFDLKCASTRNLSLKERRGSSVDRDVLRTLWECYGFHVNVCNNPTAAEMINLFERLSCSLTPNYHVFVACILSHGIPGHVIGSDGKEVLIDHLVDIIANRCPSLSGRPKVFIIQACQGDMEQPRAYQNPVATTSLLSYETDGITDSPQVEPSFSDVYKAISTVSGYASYRSVHGSVFIGEFIKQFKVFGHKRDIEEIMLKVKSELTKRNDLIQMAETRSTLRKRLIFKEVH